MMLPHLKKQHPVGMLCKCSVPTKFTSSLLQNLLQFVLTATSNSPLKLSLAVLCHLSHHKLAGESTSTENNDGKFPLAARHNDLGHLLCWVDWVWLRLILCIMGYYFQHGGWRVFFVRDRIEFWTSFCPVGGNLTSFLIPQNHGKEAQE